MIERNGNMNKSALQDEGEIMARRKCGVLLPPQKLKIS